MTAGKDPMNDVRATRDVIEREWLRTTEMLSRLADEAWATPTRC